MELAFTSGITNRKKRKVITGTGNMNSIVKLGGKFISVRSNILRAIDPRNVSIEEITALDT